MAEYYAFQAALCFSIAHIFVRRGLAGSNAFTGSVISLGTSTIIFWTLAGLLAPLSLLATPMIGYFMAAGFFAPAIGQTLGYIGMERIGVARSSPIVNTSPMFSSIFAVLFLGEIWLAQNILGTTRIRHFNDAAQDRFDDDSCAAAGRRGNCRHSIFRVARDCRVQRWQADFAF